MRGERPFLGLAVLAVLGCAPKNEESPKIVQVLPAASPAKIPKTSIHYSVDEAELIDATESEEHFDVGFYGDGNGKLLSYSDAEGHRTWRRKFVTLIHVYSFLPQDQQQFIYKEPNEENAVCSVSNGTDLITSEIVVIQTATTGTPVCWVKVTDQNGNVGWVFVGYKDPYHDDNWSIVGTVTVAGKKLLLRKYEDFFSTSSNNAARNAPTAAGKELWHPLRTDKSSYISLESTLVTDETSQGEPWVKVKDSYGRIGWFPGKVLKVERGGPKYFSPENTVQTHFDQP